MQKTLVILSVLFAIVIVGAGIMLLGNEKTAAPAAPVTEPAPVPATAPAAPAPESPAPLPDTTVSTPAPASPGPAPVPYASREAICQGLEMTVSMPGTPCSAGTLLYSEVSWTNVSGRMIMVPNSLGRGRMIGTRWQYVERLGGDPVIPKLAQSKRRGNRYLLTRANINAYKEQIQPGERIDSDRNSINLVDTTGYPPGMYRYTVEYYYFHEPPTEATPAELAQTKSVDFSIQ